MLRRVLFVLNENKTLVVRSARRMSDKPQNDTQGSKQTTTSKQQTPEEDDSLYEDYGDVKIRKGGRTIRVDESEDSGGF